ncbi:Tm-1(GCR26) protein [Tanacetum coccineum]
MTTRRRQDFPELTLPSYVSRVNSSFLYFKVEMISKAHKMRLLTTPYAFNEQEAIEMTKAGADIIVAHMGLTTSGSIGAKTTISLDESVILVQAIADAKHKINPDAIVLCHGGIIHLLMVNIRVEEF